MNVNDAVAEIRDDSGYVVISHSVQELRTPMDVKNTVNGRL